MRSRSAIRFSPSYRAGGLLLLLLGTGCDSTGVDPGSPWSLDLATGRDSTTGAVLETDQDDYLPGDSVRISGRGWAPGEAVTLHLTREPATSSDDEWHVAADHAGEFRTAFLVVPSDLGVTFRLNGTGPQSGSVVTVAFTDGNLQQVTLSPATLVVSPGSPAAFTADVIMGGTAGTCNITLSIVPPLPSGVTAAPIPSPNPTPVSPGNISFSKTITFNTSASTPNGAYTLTVRAAEGGTCNTPINSAFGTATLVVGSGNTAPVLAAIGDRTANEGELLSFTATATDEVVGTLAYTLASPGSGTFPDGAVISSDGEFSWTPSEAQGPGTYRVTVVVTDEGGLTDSEEVEIVVAEVNRAPVLEPIEPQTIVEGSLLSFTATASDPDQPANGLSFSLVDPPAGAVITPEGVFTWTPPNGPAEVEVTVRVTDDGSPALSHERVVTISVTNVAPVITSLELPSAPAVAGTPVMVTWRFDDPGADSWSCEISWDSGEAFTPAEYVSSKTCRATGTPPAGLHTVTVRVTDDAGSTEKTATASIVVYDPEGGFVTGGGWMDSPAGALASAPASSGKVTFAFSVKYLKGRLEPQGNLEIQLPEPGMTLRATSFRWLVVSGSQAHFKGVGTVQKQPRTYGFMVTVVRAGTDQLRICIWNQATGVIVYDTHPGEQLDSQAGSSLRGGSITIHNR